MKLLVNIISYLCVRVIVVLFLFSIMYSCNNTYRSPTGKYIGFWAETEFNYEFNTNQNFTFSTYGHYGKTKIKGKYCVIDSVILLYPFTSWDASIHGVLKEKLIINTKSNYLRDFENNFYCKNLEILNLISSNHYHLIDSVKDRLYKLKSVKEITGKYKNLSKYNVYHPSFDYIGIELINNKEYHRFLLRKGENDNNECSDIIYVQYQDYLVNFEYNRIYRHHTYKDSISFVGLLFKTESNN